MPNSLVSRSLSSLPATLVWTICRTVSLSTTGVAVAGVAVGTLAQVPTQFERAPAGGLAGGGPAGEQEHGGREERDQAGWE